LDEMLGSTASGLLNGEGGEYAEHEEGGAPSRSGSRAHAAPSSRAAGSKPPRRDFGGGGGFGDRGDAPAARSGSGGSGGGGGRGNASGASGSGAGRRNWYNARAAPRGSDADPDEHSFRPTERASQQQRPLDPLDADEYYARLKTQEEGEWGSGEEEEEDEEGYEEDNYAHDARLAAETRRTMAAQKRGGRGGGGSDGEDGGGGSDSDDNAAAPVLDKDILQRVRTRAPSHRLAMRALCSCMHHTTPHSAWGPKSAI
jgi:hypothetical protein